MVITGRRTDAQSFRREVGISLVHIAYWEVNSRAVRLQLQRQDREVGEMIGKEGEQCRECEYVGYAQYCGEGSHQRRVEAK